MNTDPPAHVIVDVANKLTDDVTRTALRAVGLADTIDGRRHILAYSMSCMLGGLQGQFLLHDGIKSGDDIRNQTALLAAAIYLGIYAGQVLPRTGRAEREAAIAAMTAAELDKVWDVSKDLARHIMRGRPL